MSAFFDAGLWLSVAPCVLALALAPCFGAGNAIAAGAVAALPVCVGAALALGRLWKGGLQAALAGVLAGLVIRVAGLAAGSIVLVKALGFAPVPAIASLGACVMLGLVAETAVRCRSLPVAKEPARA